MKNKEHKQRKIQRLAHARPDISNGVKELARSLQAPTLSDSQKLKHMIRYLTGTRYIRHNLRPKIQIQDKRIPFATHFFGAAMLRGSRTPATIALSSAESGLYAIGTAAQESLYISKITKEAFEARTNIRIHADSSAAKTAPPRKQSTLICGASSFNNLPRAKSSQCAG